MSGAKTAARRASKKHIEPKIEARLADFDDYKDELLNSLHEAYRRGPKTKPFDADRAWQNLKFVAFVYFQREREVTKKQSMAPAGDRSSC